MNSAIKTIKSYLSLVKFSHTVFALPFAVVGFFIGLRDNGFEFQLTLLALIVLCMVFARNAAMAFNRYADRHIDAKNPRTLGREIPQKKISPFRVLLFIIVNALLFITTTYFINKLCFFLSPVALLLILFYSISKRFTFLCHFILGLSLALAPIGAYLAVAGHFSVAPVLLSLSVLFWVSGFDIIYALQDIDFDRNNKINSIPAFMGYLMARYFAIFLHLLSLLILILFILEIKPQNYFMLSGLIIFSLLIVYQHLIIAKHGLQKINTAFFTLNGLASIVFSIFAVVELYFF